MTSQSRRLATVILFIGLCLVVVMAFVTFRRAGEPILQSSSEGEQEAALQVPELPSPIETAPATFAPVPTPLTPIPITEATPFSQPTPLTPIPTITPLPPGFKDPEFEGTPIPIQATPPSTPKPSDPFNLGVIADGIPPSTEKSTKRSGIIVVGTIKQVGPARWTTPDGKRPANPHAADNKDYIFTPVLLQVETYLKGRQLQTELTLLAFGGRVGQDSVTWESDRDKIFQEGERVVVFLERARPAHRIEVLDNRSLFWPLERYTIQEDSYATNRHSKLPLQQLLSEIQVALRKPSP